MALAVAIAAIVSSFIVNPLKAFYNKTALSQKWMKHSCNHPKMGV
jgi:hypothetical protein